MYEHFFLFNRTLNIQVDIDCNRSVVGLRVSKLHGWTCVIFKHSVLSVLRDIVLLPAVTLVHFEQSWVDRFNPSKNMYVFILRALDFSFDMGKMCTNFDLYSLQRL